MTRTNDECPVPIALGRGTIPRWHRAPATAVKAVCGVEMVVSAVSRPGANTPLPVGAVVGSPGWNPTSVAGMVSFVLDGPVVNADEVTLAVQDASDSEARWSVTVTVPKDPFTLAASMASTAPIPTTPARKGVTICLAHDSPVTKCSRICYSYIL